MAVCTSAFTSNGAFSPEACLAKPNRLETRNFVRRTWYPILSARPRCSSLRDVSASRSEYPSIAVSGLLISCAAPPTSWPSEASFSDWTSCSCKRVRFSYESRDVRNRLSSSRSSKCCLTKTIAPMSTILPSVSTSRKLRTAGGRSEEHTSELQSPYDLVCRLLLEKKKKKNSITH